LRDEPLVFGDLSGTLHLPSGTARHPALIGLHPADGASRDHVLFLHLARVLPPIGIAVLRFDRRAGAEDRFDVQADDALAAVAALASRDDIDERAIGLWGFSQGAWVAPLAASRSGAIAFLVLLASTGVTPARQMRYGTARHARAAGASDDDVRDLLALRGLYEDYHRGRIPLADMRRAIDAASRTSWFGHAYVRREPAPPGAWATLDFDPGPVFARVRVPTLLFYGEDDEWQPIDESIAVWRATGKDDLTIVRLPGTGHGPIVAGADGSGSVSTLYTDTLVAWLQRATSRPGL